MVVLNKGASDGALDLARFKAMIKGAARGRNVITGETVDLQAPLDVGRDRMGASGLGR